jgi:hypothetical protein
MAVITHETGGMKNKELIVSAGLSLMATTALAASGFLA